jgi:hypothetical protein
MKGLAAWDLLLKSISAYECTEHKDCLIADGDVMTISPARHVCQGVRTLQLLRSGVATLLHLSVLQACYQSSPVPLQTRLSRSEPPEYSVRDIYTEHARHHQKNAVERCHDVERSSDVDFIKHRSSDLRQNKNRGTTIERVDPSN